LKRERKSLELKYFDIYREKTRRREMQKERKEER
jgi:hypothetical protein